MSDTAAVIEAILFVTEEPVTESELSELLEVGRPEITAGLRALEERLEGRGLCLRRSAGGWRLYTIAEVRPYLERFAASERASRLSAAALETLAVVAYQQPVSRSQISEIRGVDSERSLRTLERRGLVQEVGKAPGPGQALLYGTTDAFLEQLGLDDLTQLPPLADHVPPADVVETLERPFRPERSSNGSTS